MAKTSKRKSIKIKDGEMTIKDKKMMKSGKKWSAKKMIIAVLIVGALIGAIVALYEWFKDPAGGGGSTDPGSSVPGSSVPGSSVPSVPSAGPSTGPGGFVGKVYTCPIPDASRADCEANINCTWDGSSCVNRNTTGTPSTCTNVINCRGSANRDWCLPVGSDCTVKPL